ncbi:endonuclease/exonuclease/phosphatase family protein [Wenyingzhuangia sp. IMCC45533]
MKKLNVLDKFLFLLNNIAAVLLLTTYVVPFVDPDNFPSIAVLSLLYPTLLTINLFFVLIWVIKLKSHFLVSLIFIGFGYQHLKALFPMNSSSEVTPSDLSVLNYNVRQFNVYKWIKNKHLKSDIANFITQENPDIVCFQEYKNTKNFYIKYPYHYIEKTSSAGQAIYSKHKIINKGSLDFSKSSNNAIFVDIKVKNQIVRVYNVHLQSFSLDTKKQYYGSSNNTTLLNRFKKVFKKQADQIKLIKKHISTCKYPTILSGDFNNTAFSWNYKQLTENHKDAFVEAGFGLGKSYNYFLPFRIDFIFPEKHMEVQAFETYKLKLSDHYPIMAKINFNN